MFAAILLAGAFATAPAWHDAQSITLPRLAQPAYARLDLPQSIDGGPNGDYPDLRIADDRNREVPYALDADPAVSANEAVALSDVGFVPGRYTQAILDLGQSGALHSAVVLSVPQSTFFERFDVASSDDRRTWAILRKDGLIYRVAQNHDAGTTTIEFGPSRARWLRIRILDGARAFPIAGANAVAGASPPRLVPLRYADKRQNDATQTVATFDFGTPYANLGAVAFETRTPQFSRRVRVALADADKRGDDDAWQPAGESTIARFAAGRPNLTIDLGNRRARLMRVTIDNGNDAPLAALRITPLGYQHHVIFRAEPNVAYRLLWLNDEAVVPTYDLAALLAHQSWSVGATATLGAPASAAFVPAAPSESTPWLQRAALPIALAIACLVLGGIALSALRAKSGA